MWQRWGEFCYSVARARSPVSVGLLALALARACVELGLCVLSASAAGG